MLQRAHNKHNVGTPAADLTLEMMVSPVTMSRMRDYEELREQRQGLNGAFICDLEQNVGFASCSSLLPSAATHALYYSFAKGRIMLGIEQLASMGVYLLFMQQ